MKASEKNPHEKVRLFGPFSSSIFNLKVQKMTCLFP